MNLPWLTSTWQELAKRRAHSGLPHALMLTGSKGLGKHRLALELAKWLLCSSAKTNNLDTPCNNCHSCQLWQAGTHPDFVLSQPEEGSRQIRVDDVRAVNEFFSKTPQVSHCQVAILRPAEVMNTNAANALLKTLEEPAGESYLILEAERIGSVLPTIRSRCQRVQVNQPEPQQAMNWLQEQGIVAAQAAEALRLNSGAPLAALAWIKQDSFSQHQAWFSQLQSWSQGGADLQKVAESWNKLEMIDVMHWFYTVLLDLSKVLLGVPAEQQELQGQVASLVQCATLNPTKLITLQTKVQATLSQQLAGTGNQNKVLLYESLLLDWLDLIKNT